MESTRLAGIVRLYARAFLDDPLFAFFVPDPKKRLEEITHIFEFAANCGLKYGEILTLESAPECAAVLLPSEHINMTVWQQIACGGLKLCMRAGLGTVHRLSYFNDFSVRLQNKHMTEKHRYLQLLGVDPEAQGQGYGGKVLDVILRRAKEEHLPLYLETENQKNLAFYAGRGFKTLEETQLPGTAIPVWAMAWYP
jgi:ribosomal protein S18 acetylase RimI-like enzyme